MASLDPISEVKVWIRDFVTQPQARLAGWPPCPYARQALLDNKVKFVLRQDTQELHDLIVEEVEQFYDSTRDMVVVVDPFPERISVDHLSTSVALWRQMAAPKGLYVMRDHPLEREVINGVCMNQGKYLLLFIQNLQTLNAAAHDLDRQGYYHSWDRESQRAMRSPRELAAKETL